MAMAKMVRVSSKGQIVLPKRIREKLEIHEGDYVFVEESKDGRMMIGKQKAGPIDAILERFRDAARAADFTREDLEKVIEEVRAGQQAP